MTTHTTRARLEALLPHAGQGTLDGEPLIPGIAQTTTFCREGIESRSAHAYSRQSNPTVSALERTLGSLENAPPAVCFGTGLGAEAALFLTLLQAGDHVVCSRALYGGTTRILERILTGFGVHTDFVDTRDPALVADALRTNTRLVFLETPSNPTLDVTDLRAVADVAHAAGVRVAVDNTFLTPLLQQPLDCGADLTVTSTTKFLEGHSAALGGSIVTRDEALLERLRFVRTCTGGIQSPFHAWLTLQGMKTLGVRLERQSATAEAVALWLTERPEVARVHYPSLASAEQQEVASRQHLGAHGAVLSFELESGGEGARAFVRQLELCRLVEHVGSVETLITHSATMTHAAVAPVDRARVGVTDGLLRISVGLEPLDALLQDLERGLASGTSPTSVPTEEVQACKSPA